MPSLRLAALAASVASWRGRRGWGGRSRRPSRLPAQALHQPCSGNAAELPPLSTRPLRLLRGGRSHAHRLLDPPGQVPAARSSPRGPLSRPTPRGGAGASPSTPRLLSQPLRIHPRSAPLSSRAAGAQRSPAAAAPPRASRVPAPRHPPNPPASKKGPQLGCSPSADPASGERGCPARAPPGPATSPPHAAVTCQSFPERGQLPAEPGMERRHGRGAAAGGEPRARSPN